MYWALSETFENHNALFNFSNKKEFKKSVLKYFVSSTSVVKERSLLINKPLIQWVCYL